MNALKCNFGACGRLFGVPRAWLSRVGGFCAHWRVIDRYVRLVVPDFPSADNPVTIGLDEDALKELCSSVSAETGTPGEVGNVPKEEGVSPKSYSWTRGGNNGVKIHVFAEAEDNGGGYTLYSAVLTFSKDGLLVSVGSENSSHGAIYV